MVRVKVHLVQVKRCEQTCVFSRNHLLRGLVKVLQRDPLLPLGPGVSKREFCFPGLGSGERDLPSLCVRAQFTGADDQHARRVHPIQSHLRVQAEPGDQVLQVGPRFLPALEAKHGS